LPPRSPTVCSRAAARDNAPETIDSVVIAACAAIAAGGGTAAVLATSAGASTVTAAHSVGHGTGRLTITGPAGKSHTRTGPVSCQIVDGRYVLRTVRKLAHGRWILRLGVSHYTSPGPIRARSWWSAATAHGSGVGSGAMCR